MIFRVRHETVYRYSADAGLEPHAVRLEPRNDPSQRVNSFELEIEPRPVRISRALDSEGNSVSYAFFEGRTSELHVRTRLEVETLRSNPFDFLFLNPDYARLPFAYPPDHTLAAEYRKVSASHPTVERLLHDARREAGEGTVGFLTRLAELIPEQVRPVIREEGHPMTPAETLAAGEAACRDLTVLYVECCRLSGLAARFVSGYQRGDPDHPRDDLHAWAEVYLPGGGWRGFDPTLGLAVADTHVALAAAAGPVGASPVSGTFRGDGIVATMETQLDLDVED